MRSASHLPTSLGSAVRSAIVRVPQRPFVCRSCTKRLRVEAAVQSRAVSNTTSRSADAVPGEDRSQAYEAAKNWEGLEWIGSRDWLYARDSLEVNHERYGASIPGVSSDKNALRLGLRRAIIESLALDEAEIPVAKRQEVLETTKNRALSTRGIGIRISANSGDARLVYNNSDVKTRLHSQLGIESPGPHSSESIALTSEEASNWRNFPFPGGSEQKFAIIKRVAQLSGTSFPDAIISGAPTTAQILASLKKQPTPRTVLQALAADSRLANLNNVTIYGKRQTYVDQDKARGRWKVIEEELVERGLPLPKGVAWSRAMRERRKEQWAAKAALD